MKTVKIIISLVLIIALISSFICTPAYAVTPETAIAAGGLAGLIAALMGLDIAYNNFNVSDLTNFFNDHAPDSPDYLSFVADVIHNPTGTISMFINKEFFKYLRSINSDIIDDYNIQSDTISTVQTYAGYSYNEYIFPYTYSNFKYGIVAQGPAFTPNSSIFIGTTNIGYEFITNGASNAQYNAYFNNSIIGNSGTYVYYASPGTVCIGESVRDHRIIIAYKGNNNNYFDTFSYTSETATYIEKGLEFDAGTLDETIGDDLPVEGGVTITAPDPGGIIDINQLIEYLKQLLLDSPDDLVTELVQEEPDPDVGPLISDTPFIDLIGLFRHLENDIQDQVNDVIGLFEESITKQEEISDVIDEKVGALEETLEEQHTDVIGLFDTAIDSIQEGFSDVIGLFEDVGETITDIYDTVVEKVGSIDLSLNSILEALQSLVESIETAAVDLFSDFLSAIQLIFAPILGRIRSALGIWHYVVEWLNCIGGVFTWIFGLCSGTAYCLVVPIYASIAAAICIALYKRFGR